MMERVKKRDEGESKKRDEGSGRERGLRQSEMVEEETDGRGRGLRTIIGGEKGRRK